MSYCIIDNVDALSALIDAIAAAEPKPFMFVDLEGINLSRHGSIAIMQVLVPPSPNVHLVDVSTLKADAFTATGSDGSSLSSLLEDKIIAKVFFDVRNDSDALYSLFGIKLQGVIDLQLLEFATRRVRGRFLKGLAKCIAEDAPLGWREQSEWEQVKQAGKRLFAPEKGGRYEVFVERPLSSALSKYCAQDVSMMPKLLSTYGARLTVEQAWKVHAEALERISLSRSPDFNGKGRHMAVGPLFGRGVTDRGAQTPFPMSLVRSEQLSSRCKLDETADVGAVKAESKTEGAKDSVPACAPRGLAPEETGKTHSPAAESSASATTNTAYTAASCSTEVTTPDSVVEALRIAMARNDFEDRHGEDSSDDDLDHDDYEGSYGGAGDGIGEGSGVGDDFTACSVDDCGYCGRCMY